MLSSALAERLPAMCGSETLATLVSSTSMNVASVTVSAMIQGLTAGATSQPAIGARNGAFAHFKNTLGSTDMPRRR